MNLTQNLINIDLFLPYSINNIACIFKWKPAFICECDRSNLVSVLFTVCECLVS